MTRGIILLCWGDRTYSFAAYNLAYSIKAAAPDVPIVLKTDGLKQVADPSVFDWIETISIDDLANPAEVKTRMYENLPFDYNLFLDVDALAIKDINGIFDKCIERGGDYYTFIYDWYDHTSPNEMPMMFWAYRDDIWRKFGFDESTRFPATQSSIQFMKKGETVTKLGQQVRANLADPIPLEQLREKWGGAQPDELYLNIALAQLGFDRDVHIGDDIIFFGYDYTLKWHEVKEQYYILSLFGGKGHTKIPYLRGYDGFLRDLHRENGTKHEFFAQEIIAKKHANKKSQPMNRVAKRMQRAQQQLAANGGTPGLNYTRKGETVLLVTNYYSAAHPARHKEITGAIQRNIDNPNIDKVLLLANDPVPDEWADDPKVAISPIGHRPTYNEMINAANTMNYDYTVLCNSDIYVDHTINLIHHSDLSDRVFCLSRYDMRGGKPVLFNYDYSQDTWIWRGKLVVDGVEFTQGLPGCDNVFAFRLTACGYQVANPAVDLRTYHLHESNRRTYTEKHRLEPPYRNVKVETIGPYLKKRALIRQNGKVGDIIICLPIAREMAGKYVVEWECDARYHPMFNYVDYVTPVQRAHRSQYDKIIDINFGIEVNTPIHREWLQRRESLDSFVRLKYEMADVPLDYRWRLEYTRNRAMEKNLADILNPEGVPFALVHADSDYGTAADIQLQNPLLKVIEFAPVGNFTIFDWRGLIERADEIHAIDSSLCNFVDVCHTTGDLYYYVTDKVPNIWDRTILKKPWKTPTNTGISPQVTPKANH